MSQKFFVLAALLGFTTAALALSQHDARVAKERMARCSYNDAVCVGNALVDALSADNTGGGRPNPYPNPGREKVVVVYGQSDTCSNYILGTIVLSSGRLQDALAQCDRLGTVSSWSVSVDGVCQNVTDGQAKTICTNTVIRTNAGN